MIFVASDLHLSHFNILKYCPHRRNGEPFPDNDGGVLEMVYKMNEQIISNWNSVVKPEDEVYVCGDCVMGQVAETHKYIARLNGKKYLVRGNHDRTLTRPRDDLNGHSYADGLFEWVKDYHELNYKKRMIVMSHFPISHWNNMSPDIEKTSILMHGHLHSPPENLHRHSGAIIDVGIDGNNLFPRTIDDAIELALNNAKVQPSTGHHD